jgi:predicted porin
MKRKAIALAVGALFAAPAAHAQITFGNESIGTVQLYGKLYPQYGYFKTTGATQPGSSVSTLVASSPTSGVLGGSGVIENLRPRWLVDTGNSYIGFRGERSLTAGGLKGIWQIETTTNFDDPSVSGTTTGRWATRDSFVGLASRSLGTVRLGQMDTVYKRYGDTFSMFGIASGNFVSASNVLSQSIGNARAARFHERRTNAIDYETPTFANITAGVMYGPDETRSGSRNATLWSYGVKWDTERFYASVHQEIHNDFFGGSSNVGLASLSNSNPADPNSHSRDMATRASGEVRFAQQRIVLDVARLTYNEFGQTVATPRFETYKHTNWAIGWDGGFGGPWRFATQFIRAGSGTCSLTGTAPAGCTTTGLQATLLTAGARYRFDRQTFVYLIAARLNNGPSALYNNSNPTPARGGDTTNLAAGISYSF